MGRAERSFLKTEVMKWLHPGPDTLIHYVTSRCNAKCAHCYFSEQLNQRNDLSPDETLRLIRSVGPLRAVLIGGGEPFLAPNLADMIIEYVRCCGVQFVQIPTMAYHSTRITDVLRAIFTSCPDLNLTINVSIDGFENFHDANRRVKGVFERAVQNVRALVALRREYPKLRVCVVSVMMPENLETLRDFACFIRDEVEPDCHILEPMRAKEFAVDDPSWKSGVEELVSFWKGLIRHYYGKPQPDSANMYASRLLRRQILAFAIHNFDLTFRNFLYGTAWPVKCTAGRGIAVIYPEGDLAVCELRKRVTNLRQYEFDVRAAMSSSAFKEETARVPKDRCFCSHGCFIPPSVRYSPVVLARLLLMGAS